MSLFHKIQDSIGNSINLKKLDTRLCNNVPEGILAPIFIVGAPRVGSTFFYQALIAKYETAYLTNLHSLFYSETCLADFLVRLLKKCGVRHAATLQSRYGFVRGLLGPSEAGPTFRYWFGESDFNNENHFTDCLKVQKSLATLCFQKKIPFVAKNLFNSMRLKEISKCFPGVFIVWVRRDRDQVVRSILKMRREIHGDDNEWVSVKVPQWQRLLDLPPEMQVQKQVVAIEEYIGKFIADRKEKNYISLDYAELCQDLEAVVDRTMSKYSEVVNKDIRIRASFSSSLFTQLRK